MNSTQVKVVVKKTIPKKTMGYLKFAYWALHQSGDNIQKLFLDRSIDEIIQHVDNIVDNGDQHITINTLHKNLRHLINTKQPKEPKAKPEPKSKSEPKSKPKEPKTPKYKAKDALDLPDTIVTQLVTLARQDFDTIPPQTIIGDTTPPILKKPRAKKSTTPTPQIIPITTEIIVETTEIIVETFAETPVETKTFAETPVEPIVETLVETPVETIPQTIPITIKKSRATPIKKIKVKQFAVFEPASPTLPTDQLSDELFI